MLDKYLDCFRKNVWLLLVGCLAFAGSAFIGSVTVDAESSTPGIWLATMWILLAVGFEIFVLVTVDCLMAVMNKAD